MQTHEFQKRCSEFVAALDERFDIHRDPQLSFTQLLEEIGELAKDINRPRLRHQEIDEVNLRGEFADVLLQLCALAKIYAIDLEIATEEKMAIISERHGLKKIA